MSTGFLILAAGAGTRMGGVPKCLIELDGQSLLERMLRELQPLCEGAQGELVLVLGHHAQAIRNHLSRQTEAPSPHRQSGSPRCVVNPHPGDDPASSLQEGLRALAAGVQQVAVLLADQPLVTGEDVRMALQTFAARAAGIHVQVPLVRGVPGHPVIFDAGVRAQLLESEGGGLRQWRAAHPQAVHLWSVDNPHYTRDLDTPADLDALARETGCRWRWPPGLPPSPAGPDGPPRRFGRR